MTDRRWIRARRVLLHATDIMDEDEGENWTRVNTLLNTVEAIELVGPTVAPTDLACVCSTEAARGSMMPSR
jgi:hypothetical protein